MANFTGTASDEIITPEFVSPTVTATGGARPSNAADTINAGGGNDIIESGGGDDVVTGGPGSDTAILGSGNDTFIWNPGDGSDVVEGGSGTDTLLFNGSNTNENMTLSANGSRTRLFRDVGNVTMDVNSMENIDINALGGTDNITIDDLTGTGVKRVAVDLSSPAGSGSGDGQVDTVTVNGTAGNDHITVTSYGTTITVKGLSEQVSITGAEAANDSLIINGGDGNDVINASTTAAGLINLTINGGAGDDTITGSAGPDTINAGDGNDVVMAGVGGRDIISLGDGDDRFVWNPGAGVDFVDGGAGNDTVVFNTSNAVQNIIIIPNGSEVVLNANNSATVISMTNIENIVINTGSGDDTIQGFNGLAPLTSLTINSGAGNDTIIGGDGADLINAGDGNDTVNGGRGNDVALLGSGNDTFIWNPGDGSDIVEGQSGTDTLVFNGSNANESMTLSANGSRTRLFRDVGNITMDVNGMENIDINAIGGADNITIDDLSGTGVKLVAVDLSSPPGSGSGDGQADTVTVNGTAGDDHVTVSTSGNVGVVNGLAAQVTVTGAEAANDRLVINGLVGTDTVTFNVASGGATVTVFAEGTDVGVNQADSSVVVDVVNVENLVINGSAGDDVIRAGNGISALTNLTINGGAGNDTIFGGDGADLINAGDGNDTVNGGRGNDVAFLGFGDDTFVWNPGDGSDTVEGQSGTDTLLFNGANVNEHIEISANGSRVRLFRDVGNVTMDLNSIENIDLNALGGADVITIDSLAGTGTRQIALDLGSPIGSGTGDGQFDTVIINGTAGNDHITVINNGTSIVINGLATQVTIAGAEAGTVTDTLVINALDGNNTVDASALATRVNLSITTGSGNDVITGSGGNDVIDAGDGNDVVTGGPGADVALLGAGDDRFIWNPGDGSDIVDGQDGTDTLVFNGSVANETFVLSANGSAATLFRDVGNVLMTLNEMEVVNLATGDGADTVVVNDLTGTGITNVAIDLASLVSHRADGALDQVMVNGTAGNDFITLSNAGGAVNVNGLAAQVSIAHADGALDQITVAGGLGDDVIDASGLAANQILLTLNGGDGNDVLFGSRGNDTVIGGRGNDISFMGGGNDRFIWNPGDGSDTVDGGDGFDTMVFSGANVGEKMELSGANGQSTLTRDVGAITMRMTSMEEVDMSALGGADNITVDDLTGSGVKQVAIDLSAIPGSGVGDGQADIVTVNGTMGNDHIKVASNATSVMVSGLAAQVTINGAEAANDTLVINSQPGNDVIDASGLQGGLINLVLNGFSGNDTLIGSQGNDTLAGGFGADTFVFGGNFGQDVIQGFFAGTTTGLTDVVQFDRSIFSSFADVQAHAQQIGNDTTITVDPNRSVTLQNVALNSLSANDFRFA